jgi:hypothetical protein
MAIGGLDVPEIVLTVEDVARIVAMAVADITADINDDGRRRTTLDPDAISSDVMDCPGRADSCRTRL